MKKKIVTVLMTAMLGSSILFAQTAMAADTAEQTEDTAKADETSEEKTEELKTIGEKPEKETEGILDVKLKNLTGKVITGFTIKNEKDEKYPDNFLKEDDKFAADEERELWFDLNKKDETSDAEKTEDATKGSSSTSRAARTAWPVPHGLVRSAGLLNPSGRFSSDWNAYSTSVIFSILSPMTRRNSSSRSLRIIKTTLLNPASNAS